MNNHMKNPNTDNILSGTELDIICDKRNCIVFNALELKNGEILCLLL